MTILASVKPKDDVTNIKEFIQIYDKHTEFSNNDQLKEKEITKGNKTTDSVPSNNPLNATQATQQQAISTRSSSGGGTK